jgi:site-specific DNA-cytosine methylase
LLVFFSRLQHFIVFSDGLTVSTMSDRRQSAPAHFTADATSALNAPPQIVRIRASELAEVCGLGRAPETEQASHVRRLARQAFPEAKFPADVSPENVAIEQVPLDKVRSFVSACAIHAGTANELPVKLPVDGTGGSKQSLLAFAIESIHAAASVSTQAAADVLEEHCCGAATEMLEGVPDETHCKAIHSAIQKAVATSRGDAHEAADVVAAGGRSERTALEKVLITYGRVQVVVSGVTDGCANATAYLCACLSLLKSKCSLPTVRRVDAEGRVLESKHRRHRLLRDIPRTEQVQLEAYLWLTDTSEATHVQHFEGQVKATLYHHDHVLWSDVLIGAARVCERVDAAHATASRNCDQHSSVAAVPLLTESLDALQVADTGPPMAVSNDGVRQLAISLANEVLPRALHAPDVLEWLERDAPQLLLRNALVTELLLRQLPYRSRSGGRVCVAGSCGLHEYIRCTEGTCPDWAPGDIDAWLPNEPEPEGEFRAFENRVREQTGLRIFRVHNLRDQASLEYESHFSTKTQREYAAACGADEGSGPTPSKAGLFALVDFVYCPSDSKLLDQDSLRAYLASSFEGMDEAAINANFKRNRLVPPPPPRPDEEGQTSGRSYFKISLIATVADTPRKVIERFDISVCMVAFSVDPTTGERDFTLGDGVAEDVRERRQRSMRPVSDTQEAQRLKVRQDKYARRGFCKVEDPSSLLIEATGTAEEMSAVRVPVIVGASFYSGCGQMDEAVRLAAEGVCQPMELALVVENDPLCTRLLAARFPGVELQSDAMSVNTSLQQGAQPDILFGGPPCIAFSAAGAQLGLLDPRPSASAGLVSLATPAAAWNASVILIEITVEVKTKDAENGALTNLRSAYAAHGYELLDAAVVRFCDVGGSSVRRRLLLHMEHRERAARLPALAPLETDLRPATTLRSVLRPAASVPPEALQPGRFIKESSPLRPDRPQRIGWLRRDNSRREPALGDEVSLRSRPGVWCVVEVCDSGASLVLYEDDRTNADSTNKALHIVVCCDEVISVHEFNEPVFSIDGLANSPTRWRAAPRWQVGLILDSRISGSAVRYVCEDEVARLQQFPDALQQLLRDVGATWHDVAEIAGNSNPIALYKASATRAVRRTAMHVALRGADEAAPVSTNAVPPVQRSKSSKGPSCEQAGTAADLPMPARSQSLPARLLHVAPDWSDC